MESRKISSLSVRSDSSDSSVKVCSNQILEKICDLDVAEAAEGRFLRSSGNIVSCLLGETQAFVAEVKLRADSECSVSRRTVVALPGVKDDKRYLCLDVFQVAPGQHRLLLLGERKNKERFVSITEVITSERVLSLGQELCTYDKASMLGKGLSHVAAFSEGHNGETDVFTFSNIIRKLKVEDSGACIKPTSGRAPVPPECTDGTISTSVAESQKGFSIICSFRTKSAGKNKYQVNWFTGRKEEISAPSGKSAIKLPEDQEPSIVLIDPRDSRSAFILYNQGGNSSHFAKLVRGRKIEEPIASFSHTVQDACFLTGPDRSLFLLVLERGAAAIRVFHLTKTEGYRGLPAIWSSASDCQELHNFQHALSCSQFKWHMQVKTVDYVTSGRCHYQVGLATLFNKGEIATEPESGLPYRIRLLGGDAVNDILLVLLDDLERTFESEEDSLSSMSLKVCMNGSPGREGVSQVSGWLMAGRLASIDIYSCCIEPDSPLGSDRLTVHQMSTDVFRNYLLDVDWSQANKKEGTFVLDSSNGSSDSRPQTASLTASYPAPHTHASSRPTSSRFSGSRIPSATNRRSLVIEPPHCNGETSSLGNHATMLEVISQVEETISPLARANAQIRESLEGLERSLLFYKNLANSNGTESDPEP